MKYRFVSKEKENVYELIDKNDFHIDGMKERMIENFYLALFENRCLEIEFLNYLGPSFHFYKNK